MRTPVLHPIYTLMRPIHTPHYNARYAGWATQPWSDIDTETLEDGNKNLMKMLRAFSNTNQIVKGWGTYKNMEQKVKDMTNVLPLINDLHSDAMQVRHWKSLSKVRRR